jgi:hypothetical protein
MKTLFIAMIFFCCFLRVYGMGNRDKEPPEETGAGFVIGAPQGLDSPREPDPSPPEAGSPPEKTRPVITGGWREMEFPAIDEAVTAFAGEQAAAHVTGEYTLHWERAWTQLVHGRRYLLAYSIQLEDGPTSGIVIVLRDYTGLVSLEKIYSQNEVLDFIGLLLTGEESGGKTSNESEQAGSDEPQEENFEKD